MPLIAPCRNYQRYLLPVPLHTLLLGCCSKLPAAFLCYRLLVFQVATRPLLFASFLRVQLAHFVAVCSHRCHCGRQRQRRLHYCCRSRRHRHCVRSVCALSFPSALCSRRRRHRRRRFLAAFGSLLAVAWLLLKAVCCLLVVALQRASMLLC